MPRIPESEIERIKKETDLAALVRSRGIERKCQSYLLTFSEWTRYHEARVRSAHCTIPGSGLHI
jgi:hypothetical protein